MTDLELYNITLSIFDREITQDDLDSQTPSKEVRLCRRYLPLAKLKVLREFDWSFLIEKLQIELVERGGYKGFLYGFLLPEGLLKVVRNETDYPYEVIGNILYTDIDNPTIFGIMEDFKEDHAPKDFYELIAYALAYQIAPLLAPEGRFDQVVLQKYSWALNGLISAECHNNSKEN
jgi:hypothetical protein